MERAIPRSELHGPSRPVGREGPSAAIVLSLKEGFIARAALPTYLKEAEPIRPPER